MLLSINQASLQASHNDKSRKVHPSARPPHRFLVLKNKIMATVLNKAGNIGLPNKALLVTLVICLYIVLSCCLPRGAFSVNIFTILWSQYLLLVYYFIRSPIIYNNRVGSIRWLMFRILFLLGLEYSFYHL